MSVGAAGHQLPLTLIGTTNQPMTKSINVIIEHIKQRLIESNWSVFYIANFCHELDGVSSEGSNLSFEDALSLIKRLPVEDSYFKEYDPKTGWAGTKGPYLAFGTPDSHRGEGDAVVFTPTFTFTKQEVEELLT